MRRYAVFSCQGLGDGLIALVLSNNLQLNGGSAITFHPFLDSLQGWFPDLQIQRFPAAKEIASTLMAFERVFIIFEKSPWMQQILEFCQKNFPEKTTVLNPIATKRRDYPYWESGRFDGTRTFVENLYTYCREILKFNVVTRSNGIQVPEGVQPGRYARRVVIHPTSSREGKNWPREKYLALASRLGENGYAPAILLTGQEREVWDPGKIDAPRFANLGELAAFVAESGGMIGNDSGVGHLASCLGVKTVTVCRSAQASRFWRPSWARGSVVLPSSWIPNIKGLRLRDRYWKRWISVGKVLASADALSDI